MKKIYVVTIAVFFTAFLFGQKIDNKVKKNAIPQKAEYVKNKTNTQISKKAPGDVFWYEDFANGLNGNAVDGSGAPIGGSVAWTKGYAGANDYSTVWVYDNTGPQGQYEGDGIFNSESSGNGWMLFDANLQTDNDPNTDADGFLLMDGWIESPEIDISGMGTSALGLEYQQSFRTCCSETENPIQLFVMYYDDLLNDWVLDPKAGSNIKNNLYPSNVGGTGYSPEIKLINLNCQVEKAQLSSTKPNIIKIRFHWNPSLSLENSYYFWMIDDIRIKEINDADGDLFNMYSGDIVNDFEYYAIPSVQITAYPLVVMGEIANIGGADLTGVSLQVNVTEDATSSIVHSSTSPPISIATCEDAKTITYNTGFIPTNDGVYTVELTSTSTEVDGNTANNVLSKKFEKTYFEMGHYNPFSTDLDIYSLNRAAGGTTRSGKAMSLYTIYEDAIVYGMYVYFLEGITTINTIDQIVKVTLYDASDAVTILTTQDFVLAHKYPGKIVPIRFATPLVVVAGDTFYASIDAAGGGDYVVIAADYDSDEDNSTLIDINGTLYSASFDPYVNISFDPKLKPIGLTENKKIGITSEAFPNPANNSTEIKFSIAYASNVSIEVTDVTGKVIVSKNIGTKAAGNQTFELSTANLSDGIYYYTLVAGQDRLTNKLVVRK